MIKISQAQQLEEEIKKIGDIPILVEGRKDRQALTRFGVKNILDISGRTPEKVLDQTLNNNINTIIVLTDFDEEGEKKSKQFTKLFEANGIKVNSKARYKIKSLINTHQIEGLNSFIKSFGDDYNGKISSVYYKIFDRGKLLNRRGRRKT